MMMKALAPFALSAVFLTLGSAVAAQPALRSVFKKEAAVESRTAPMQTQVQTQAQAQASVTQGAEPGSDITLISASETEVVLEFRPKWREPETLDVGGVPYTAFNFEGAHSDIRRAGLPDIQTRSVSLIAGSEKLPSVQILSAETEEIPNTNLAPVPHLKLPASPVSLETSRTELKVSFDYARAAEIPVATASQPAIARGYFLTTLSLAPMRYNALTKTLTKYKRLQVRVSFEKFAAQRSPNGFAGAQSAGDRMLSGILNFGAAKAWQQIPARSAGKSLNGKNNNGLQAVTESVLRSGRFFKLELREEGIYRLDRAYLESLGINTGAIDPRKIKVYFNGGEELPQTVNSPKAPDLTECAITVEGEADGRFDATDYVLFYATATAAMRYDEVNRRLTHSLNRLSTYAYAFLTVDGENGKRIESAPSLQSPSPVVPQSFEWLSFTENDRVHFSNTGADFFDTPLSASRTGVTYSMSVSGIDKSKPVLYTMRYATLTQRNETVQFRDGASLLAQQITDVTSTYYRAATPQNFQTQQPATVISGETSQFSYSFTASTDGARLYPDWVDLNHWRLFAAQNNLLVFTSLVGLTQSSTVEYRLTGLGGNPRVWDITDLSNIKTFTGLGQAGGVSVQAAESPNLYRRYAAFSDGAPFKTPASAAAVPNQNLRAIPATNPQYIVVYSPDFKEQALKLVQHRSDVALFGANALRSVAVDVDQIYNEFSGGKQDFTAIRDFFKYLYDNASTPNPELYALLYGDGDWDFRDIVRKTYRKVPMYESNESFYDLQPHNNDEAYFTSVLGEGFIPEFPVGRLTVQTPQQAETALQKIISYETLSAQGEWRNTVALVADDGPNGEDSNDGVTFSRDNESIISGIAASSPYLNYSKLYAAFYKEETVGGGRRRPDAYQAIIDQLNRGALAINYIGHGNPVVWTSEAIFQPATSLLQLTNSDRLTFCTVATCDFGRADDPSLQSGSEDMLTKAGGGAIGLITTNRAILISSGSSNPPIIFRRLFERNPAGLLNRVGESYYRFKLDLGGSNDTDKFYLLCDPALRLVAGKSVAVIDSINGKAPSAAAPDTLKALSRVSLAGSTPDAGFNGKALVTLLDAPRLATGETGANTKGASQTVQYSVQNTAIFKGVVPVANGKFRVNFIVPKDISYSTGRGKISLHAWKDTDALSDNFSTATGQATNIVITGTDASATADAVGPALNVHLNDERFVSGGVVGQTPLFIASLEDESGINLAQGIGHALTLTLDGDERNPVELNDFYEASAGSFTAGTIRYPIRELAPGKHTLKFKAWDNFNNSTERTLNFTVESSASLAVSNVYNYPNPFRDRTAFIFSQNRTGDDLKTTIKIYTVGGRLIKTLEQTDFASRSQVRLEWDGRDEDGSQIANGVYLYKVIIQSLSGEFRRELLEKLAVFR